MEPREAAVAGAAGSAATGAAAGAAPTAVADAAASLVAVSRGGRGSGIALGSGRALVAGVLRGETLELERPDGVRVAARVLGRDRDRGLAVVEADLGALPPLAWPEADPQPALGAPVVALARPAGRPLYRTEGAVAAVGERVRSPRGRLGDPGIVHTAPLPRGTAGSPLLGADGTLLGLNAARIDGGFVLALPATAALREAVERLVAGEAPAERSLGVAVAAPRTARRLRAAVGLPARDGLLVQEVAARSPAERAGLAAGDLIVAAAGRDADSIDALIEAVDGAGAELTLRVVRGVDERDVVVRWEE